MIRRGFTLIELAACLVILGLLAAAAAVSLTSVNRTATMQDVIGRIRYWDQLARHRARRFDEPAALVFDLDQNSVTQKNGNVDDSSDDQLHWSLPRGYSFVQVRTVESLADRSRATIRYTPSGCSPTYALELANPDHRNRWILIAGLTGQVTTIDKQEHLRGIFKALLRPSHDVD